MVKQRCTSAVLATVLMLGTGGVMDRVWADTAPAAPATKPVVPNAMLDQRLKLSDDGFRAERDIGSARIAIFQGDVDRAKTLVADASTDLATLTKQAPTDYPPPAPAPKTAAGTPPSTTAMAAVPAGMVPFDGQMVVADNMVLTPDKAAKVKEANDHLKSGDVKGAMDTLKQGQIDVAFTRLLMPVDGTDTHVKAATTLLDQGKYYEANLALKAAQDLVQTDTVAFDDSAAQAAKMTGVPAATASGAPAPSTAAPVKN